MTEPICECPPGMWHHYCEEEETTLAVGEGEPCSWCGETEPNPGP